MLASSDTPIAATQSQSPSQEAVLTLVLDTEPVLLVFALAIKATAVLIAPLFRSASQKTSQYQPASLSMAGSIIPSVVHRT